MASHEPVGDELADEAVLEWICPICSYRPKYGNRYKRQAKLNWARYSIKRHLKKHEGLKAGVGRCGDKITNDDGVWICVEVKGHERAHKYAPQKGSE